MSEVSATRDTLKEARARLQLPLRSLQGMARRAELDSATQFVADACDWLYRAEQEIDDPAQHEPVTQGIRRSMECLGRALGVLEASKDDPATPDEITESVARALALLYPVAQGRMRRRRAVMLGGPEQLREPIAYVPAAPKPPQTRSSAAPGPRQRPNRRGTPRATLEVDIGLLSDSHFYTGLSMDVSKGGLFVATYDPLPPGSLLTLFFVLPSGAAVEAPGTVRWTRAGNEDTPPGMGVAFETLSEAARAAIASFCEQRTPLYHDSADD